MKIGVLSLLACILIIAGSGCSNSGSAMSIAGKPPSSTPLKLNESTAVSLVLDLHPDYPRAGQIKQIKTTAGGPYPGTKLTGVLQTSVQAASDGSGYIVTLLKDWKIKVNGKEAERIWKYKVSNNNNLELISSTNNANLIHTIK